MTADQDLSARLLPCPFCGGEGRYRIAYGIVCNGCNARLPSTYEDAVTEWNRRVPADHQAAVQAAVAKAVEAGDDAIRAANTLMLILSGGLPNTKASVEAALARMMDARCNWDAAILRALSAPVTPANEGGV